jgi:hypothetical protein
MLPIVGASGSLALPLARTAAWLFSWGCRRGSSTTNETGAMSPQRATDSLRRLPRGSFRSCFPWPFIVSAGIGVFEVGLALAGAGT